MLRFKNLSIKKKLMLVVLLTSSIGLFISVTSTLAYDWGKQREILAQEMTILSRVIASRSAAAVSFDDQLRAIENLSSLLLRKSVISACIYNAQAHVFASVDTQGNDGKHCQGAVLADGHYFFDHYLDVYQSITLNGMSIGTLMVRTGLEDLDERLKRQVLANFAILLISLLGALLLTSRLQRAIYQPIVRLGEVASQITQENNYTIRAEIDSNDELGHTVAAFNTMLNKIEQDKGALTRLAYFDPLTELPNRRMFSEQVEAALSQARRSRIKIALIFVDLDKFKKINDELGHDIGDLLLKSVAKRLSASIPKTATAFRLGGDEFTVLQVGLTNASDIEVTATSILDTLREPLILAGTQLAISASLGIAVSDGHDNLTSIMKSADIALYKAKDAGRDNFQVFSHG